MTDMMAYNRNLPCLNPNCKSHGRPHPNCRCYSGLSKGGSVDHFCSSDNPHQEGCEYYMSEGGEIDPSKVVPDEDIDPSAVKVDEEIPADQVKVDSDKYGSPEQHWKMRAEAAGRGFLGPAAPWAETHLMGVDPQDIKGREAAYPTESKLIEAGTFVGSMLTGTGEAGLIAKGASAVSKATELGKVGSMALKGFIEAASFAGADETTKAILHQPGSDPETPVSQALLHVGAAGLMGGIGGSVFGLGEKMIGKGLESLENKKVVDKAQEVLSKLGGEGDPLDKLGITKSLKNTVDTAAWPAAAVIKVKSGGTIPIGVAYSAIQKIIEKPFEKVVGKLNGYATDGIIHCLMTNSAEAVPNAIHYARNIARGASAVNSAMSSLFSAGAAKIVEDASEKEKENLNDFIVNGQVGQQIQNSMQGSGFASGGMVSSSDDHFSKAFQTQNMLLSAAKGRVSNYLNSIRPTANDPRLPFDKPKPDKEKQRSYDRALGFAVKPIKILDHVNNGDLTPDDMKHFLGMYPELHKHLSGKMTEKIVESQLKDEAPPYKKRQAMSLFLGAPLDSTFTPQAISTIQGVYAIKSQQQQQQPQKPKKSGSSLSKLGTSAMTDAQARTNREQNQKA